MNISIISSYIFYYSGMINLWNRFINNKSPIIIYYHDIFDDRMDYKWTYESSLLLPHDMFESHLNFLLNNYQIVSLDEAINYPSSKNIAITFDDGFRGIYRRAFPILKKLKLPATVFLTTDFIGSSDLPWWEQLLFQLHKLSMLQGKEKNKILSDLSSKWHDIFSQDNPINLFLTVYKESKDSERREISKIFAQHIGGAPASPERIFLSADEIQEMSSAGITFGAHTRTHPILTWLDESQVWEEMHGSKVAVLSLTGDSNCWFAYPDGVFTDRELRLAQEADFIGAVQTYRYPEMIERFCLPRIGLNMRATTGFKGFSPARIAAALSGFTKYQMNRKIKAFFNK